MEVVINDTNILIDLYNAGLLSYCRELDIEFRTLDLIIDEIKDEQQGRAIQSLIDDGTLKVYSLSSSLMTRVFNMMIEYQGVCNLSAVDISVMVYAKHHHCRLLTGDKVLRQKAEQQNIIVSGILYLTDMMIARSIVETQEMIEALGGLLHSNNRLPRKLIDERINKLKQQIEP